MTAPEPTQPLTGDEESLIREWHNKTRDPKLGRALAEVDRLRTENTALVQSRADLRRELAALSEAVEDAEIANESLRQERDQLRQWNASRLSPDPSALDQSGEGQANA